MLTLRGGVVGLNLVAMLGLAMLMPRDAYGGFVLAWSLAMVLSSLFSLGAPTYLLKEFARTSVGGGLDLGHVIRLSIVYPAGLAFLAQLAISPVSEHDLVSLDPLLLTLVIWLGFLINLCAVMASALHGLGALGGAMALRDGAPQATVLVAALALWTTGQVQTAALLILTIGLLTGLLLLCGLLAFRANRVTGMTHRKGRSGSFTTGYWGGAITGTLWAQIDILIGSAVLSTAELGTYNILRRLANLVTLPLTISTWVTVGDFSRAFHRHDAAALGPLLRKSLKISLGPGLLLAIGVVLALPLIGNVYAFPAAPVLWAVMAPLLGQALVTLAFSPTITIANTSGLERSAMTARIVGCLVFCLCLTAGQGGGMAANAAALVLGTLALNGWVWLHLRRRFGIDSSALHLVRGT